MDIDLGTARELGRAAFAQVDRAAAEARFRAALAAGGDDREVQHHLGFLARQRGDLEEAGARYEDALEHAPSDPHVLNNLAEVRRAAGRLAEAAGQTVLVHAEQGHGDTIQYLRYIPMLRARAGRVLLEVQPALTGLLDGVPDVYARGEELPGYKTHCSFMSLPRAFRTTGETIPADVPYLSVPPAALAKWRERLGTGDGRRRIAVAWTGASSVWNRSIPLRLLAPLLRRSDCAFHVVQTDMEPGDRELLAEMPWVIDHSPELESFADSAAVVACTDLVVTVDTALCHLAGALAMPVWTMLPFGAEYRWRTEGVASAWYPTMRLFRQPALSDWASVIDAIQHALSA